MKVIEINNLSKNYEKFSLKDVSFSVKKGRIMGFIGRNGAGKSTTLKCLLNFVHPNGGKIKFFEKDFDGNELEIKQKIGFVSGGINYYGKKKIKTITSVTKKFYNNWNEDAYQKYISRFNIDESKTPEKLSEGMKVKYSLALALSHNAELLILDEPTSGLDPVSRDELLDEFLRLSEKGISILFSTHITSDLEKCADDITYIRKGKIIASEDINTFTNKYKLAVFPKDADFSAIKDDLIGLKKNKNDFSALVNSSVNELKNATIEPAKLEDIMIHFEKEED